MFKKLVFETENLNDYPYNPKDLRIEQKMLSVFALVKSIKANKLVLRPKYQRNFLWDHKKQSALIESLMLRIPIPAFYLDEDEEGVRNVIDGQQRLTTIERFMANELKLCNLQYLTQFNGKTFSELEYKYQQIIEDSQLAVNILDSQCPLLLKLDIFRRVNTGGVTLNAQELRNIMLTPRIREYLNNIISNDIFGAATHLLLEKNNRMQAQQLYLGFVAYYMCFDYKNKCFKYFGDMIKMIDKIVEVMNRMSMQELEIYWHTFKRGLENSILLFGDKSFVKPYSNKKFNRALFISFSIILSYYNNLNITNLRYNQNENYKKLEKLIVEDKEYSSALSASTTSKKNMLVQFLRADNLVRELL